MKSENYYMTLNDYVKTEKRIDQLKELSMDLRISDSWNRYVNDPDIDLKRRAAIDALKDALVKFNDAEEDRLYSKLDSSDDLINWNKILKKFGLS